MNGYHTKYSLNVLPLLAKWVLGCLLLTPAYAYSQESILAVMSGDNKIYKDFYSRFKSELHDNINIVKTTVSDVNNEVLNRHDFIITIGYRAAKKISEYKPKSTVIYSLIPDNEKIRSRLSCANKTCYYIYINQPVTRYTKLFKILFPQDRIMVLATTKANTKIAQQLQIASRNMGVTYKKLQIQQDSNIARTFTNELSKGDVLLALPNTAIYNANNAKSILLSTYHKNVPIIAYSKAFVKAGAIAGLYSSIENIADQTAKTANEIMKAGHQKQKEYYPDDFTIEINSTVAKSLNINIDSESVIKRKFK